jgi:hypothetical protein
VGGAGACPGNQVKTAGVCMCPGYAPTFCEAIPKCIKPMSDPDNCGGCAKPCGMTNACDAGVCTPDLTPVGEVAGCGSLALVSAGTTLYALSTMTGALSSFTLPAGGMPKSVATGLTGGTAFTVDATNAYVAAGMSLKRVNLMTGAIENVVTETKQIFDVAVDTGKLYYATDKFIKQVDATAKDGMGTTVATSIDEGEAQGVAVSGAVVLYASNSAYNLEEDPIAGDMHYKIGASQSGLIFGHRSVQADATNVYWVNSGVQSAPVAGTEHPGKTVLTPIDGIDGGDIVAFAVDGAKKTSYAATKNGMIEKSTFDTGSDEAKWVARGITDVSSIVLDDTSMYIASGCKILKAAR